MMHYYIDNNKVCYNTSSSVLLCSIIWSFIISIGIRMLYTFSVIFRVGMSIILFIIECLDTIISYYITITYSRYTEYIAFIVAFTCFGLFFLSVVSISASIILSSFFCILFYRCCIWYIYGDSSVLEGNGSIDEQMITVVKKIICCYTE